ncbi:MAG: GAK system XXXCH domain-containing protein [Desulfobacterales bacterium]
MGSGEKTAYKGLTKAQLAHFFREFADKLEGVSEKTEDADTEDSTEDEEVSEEASEKIADAAEEVSKEILRAAEDSAEPADLSEEVSENIADAAEDISEKTLTTAEDSIEDEEISGENIVIPDFDPENFQKLEMGIKKGGEGFSLKVKIKISSESEEEKEEKSESGKKEKSRYKKTKKRMKSTFKEISESLENDTLPDESAVTSFLQDSRLMTSFSEYGAEFFPEYDKACEKFRKAFEDKEMEACKTAYSELNRLRKDCHKRYKD